MEDASMIGACAIAVPRVPLAKLLEWAHSPEPPTNEMRVALPWLSDDREIRCYFEGLVRGRIDFWRFGPLFQSDATA